ncbi:GATA transcription factor 18-like [Hibiscus syriacus]|uniref:GATA transcription factor 18-like n=1 Tax=Hibiscus syriacus TaxID=106335 RepID=UPI0019227733|nr:GATA transcription factor 18-like [Hibiscus syriacus]
MVTGVKRWEFGFRELGFKQKVQGTPSTRLSEEDDKHTRHERTSGDPCMSKYCWELLLTTKASRGSNGNGSNSSDIDPLLARRCANFGTSSTRLWKNRPRGPKSLCNACGIRFKKEERRASAANAINSLPFLETQRHR